MCYWYCSSISDWYYPPCFIFALSHFPCLHCPHYLGAGLCWSTACRRDCPDMAVFLHCSSPKVLLDSYVQLNLSMSCAQALSFLLGFALQSLKISFVLLGASTVVLCAVSWYLAMLVHFYWFDYLSPLLFSMNRNISILMFVIFLMPLDDTPLLCST